VGDRQQISGAGRFFCTKREVFDGTKIHVFVSNTWILALCIWILALSIWRHVFEFWRQICDIMCFLRCMKGRCVGSSGPLGSFGIGIRTKYSAHLLKNERKMICEGVWEFCTHRYQRYFHPHYLRESAVSSCPPPPPPSFSPPSHRWSAKTTAVMIGSGPL